MHSTELGEEPVIGLNEQLALALSLLRSHRVRTFLLSNDQEANIKYATHPALRSYAQCVRIVSESTSTQLPAAAYSFKVGSKWLMVPAPSDDADGCSLGILIAASEQGNKQQLFTPGFSHTNCLRFARHTRTKSYINIGHYREEGYTEITSLCQTSYRARRGIALRFKTSKFMEAMSNVEAPAIDYRALTDALSYVYQLDESAFCPHCTAPPHVTCACEADFVYCPEDSPGSLGIARQKLSYPTGQYSGHAALTLYMTGFPWNRMKMTRTTSVENWNHANLKSLLDLASRDIVCKLKPSVPRLVSGCSESSDGYLFPPLFAEGTMPTSGIIHSVLADTPSPDSFSAHQSSPHESDSQSDVTLLGLFPVNSKKLLHNVQMLELVSEEETPRGEEQLQAMDISPTLSVPQRKREEPVEIADCSNSVNMDRCDEGKSQESGESESGSDDVSDMQSKALEILREKGGSKSMTFAELAKLVPLEPRELRKVFRRLRNQESAARSNLKRKRRLEALRRNLAEIRETLRARQIKYEQLSEENFTLRCALDSAQRRESSPP